MVFSSLIFLFVFLPIVFGMYFVLPKRSRNHVLLLASLFFYSWGEVSYVVVMISSIVINYGFGISIEKTRHKKSKKQLLILGLGINLAILVGFKYWNFITDNINILLEYFNFHEIKNSPTHLPIGISFFTFQAMSYLIDVYRSITSAQKNFTRLALYISLFPQLIAGPIVRYHDIATQLNNRNESYNLFSSGVQRFIIGLAKKVLIANVMASVADSIFILPTNQLSVIIAWLGIIAYTLQIYFDFSGYSDMAIGLGMIFGFRFLENFAYPYTAKSIQEFWRRWHISLSNWFRDYLYIPLGGSRKGPIRTYINLFIVFILCGLWHGASWNFLIWGLVHGSFLALERAGLLNILRKTPNFFRHFYVLLVIMLSWVFFRTENLTHAMSYLMHLFIPNEIFTESSTLSAYLNNEVFLVLLVGIIGSTPLIQTISRKIRANAFRPATGVHVPKFLYTLLHLTSIIGIFFLSILDLSAGAYNPFIYFRF